jgi:group II intron reverse transcriptase/maturase
MLKTPDNIRELQRKLYLKAKQEKNFRFYLLYDKVYRWDILSHAYRLTKAKKGAPGIDGITFEAIEGMKGGVEGYLRSIQSELKTKTYKVMPIRRVYIPKPGGGRRPLSIPTIRDRVVQMATKMVIEPIFEADFKDSSYGFRPRRDAHQAIEDVTRELLKGKMKVIDADISRYFDTIPHDRLLNEVARRIVDRQILRLIKMWLKCPIVEEREDGKKEYKKNDRGTPQGGVISPLLANIYLNTLDTIWKIKRVEERMEARLVRYADDLLVISRKNAHKILEGIKKVIEGLELTLNEDKTKIVDARIEGFNFLGFTIRVVKSPRTSRNFPLTRPSKEALKSIRAEIKGITKRSNLHLPKELIIQRLNEVVRGWVQYFYFKNCTQDLSQLRYYLTERVRRYLRRKYGKKKKGYKSYPNQYLYRVLGLYEIPLVAPWKRTVRALR